MTRSAVVGGDWHLWIYHCEWTLAVDRQPLAHSPCLSGWCEVLLRQAHDAWRSDDETRFAMAACSAAGFASLLRNLFGAPAASALFRQRVLDPRRIARWLGYSVH